MPEKLAKALAAVIMGVLSLGEYISGWHPGVSEDAILTTLGVIASILIWLMPGKSTNNK